MANEEPMIRLGRRAFLQHGTLLLTAAALRKLNNHIFDSDALKKLI